MLWLSSLSFAASRDLVFPIPDRAPAHHAVLPDDRDLGISGQVRLTQHTRVPGSKELSSETHDGQLGLFCFGFDARVMVQLRLEVDDWPTRLPEALSCGSASATLRILPLSVPSLDDPAPLDPAVVRHVRHYEGEGGRWLRLPDDEWVITEQNAEASRWERPNDDLTLGRCMVRASDGGPLLWFEFPLDGDGKEGTCTMPRAGAEPVTFRLVPELVRVSTKRTGRAPQ